MNICGYYFYGPYRIGDKPIDRAAVYVILDETNKVIDVDWCSNKGINLARHKKRKDWLKHRGLWCAFRWTPSGEYAGEDSRRIIGRIRKKEKPPCGDGKKAG